MKKRLLLYTRFERFWHWVQAGLIIFLLVSGFEIHGSWHLFGYERACRWHNNAGIALLILTAFAIFWHFTTGQWRHYVPEFTDLKKIARYYLVGILHGEKHPFHKSEEKKLNPLQALTYLKLKLIFMPVQLVTGLLYYYYDRWQIWGLNMRLDSIALLHTAMAFVLLVFLLVHVYLTTTGGTITAYIKAMITGWEEVEE